MRINKGIVFFKRSKIFFFTVCLLVFFSEASGQETEEDVSDENYFKFPEKNKEILSTTSTTTKPKPALEVRKCGLYRNMTCERRSECSTTMNKGPKLVVDLRESSKNRCHYLEVCCHPDDKLKPLDAAIHMEHNQCGISNVGGVFMTLTGGRLETSFAEFAWTAAILDAGHNFLCNGVLISRKVVMTTATCLTTEEPLIVRAGDWDLVTDREAVQHENRTVKDRVVHQQFRWDSTQYNIALLILTEEFPRLQHIVPVCLAPMTPVDLDKESCFVCGWNHRIVSKTPSARNIVLKMEMDIDKSSWSNNSRSTILEGTPRSEQPVYAKGAPLVCPTESSRYYLVGIWSTSLNGGTQFTDVRQFRLWINRELRPFNIFL